MAEEEAEAVSDSGQKVVVSSTSTVVVEGVGVAGVRVAVITGVVEAAAEGAGGGVALSDSGQKVVVSSTSTVVVDGVGAAVGLSVSGQIVVVSSISTVVTDGAAPEPGFLMPNWVEYWYWPVASSTRSRP